MTHSMKTKMVKTKKQKGSIFFFENDSILNHSDKTYLENYRITSIMRKFFIFEFF